MDAAIAMVMGFDCSCIAVSAVGQVLFAMAWFGGIVHHIDRYYRAADKGVRRFEHAIQRYPPVVVAGITLLCAILRTVVVLSVASVIKASTLLEYEYAAVITSVIGLMGAHRHFAGQRPIQLAVTEFGYEAAAAMIAAVVCFYMKSE